MTVPARLAEANRLLQQNQLTMPVMATVVSHITAAIEDLAVADTLDAFSPVAIQFSRGTEASYMLSQSPPKIDPGTGVVLAWAPRDVLRMTDTGLPIIENAPTHVNVSRRDFSTWTAGTAALTAGAATGPDGTAAVATRVQAVGNQNGPYALPGPAPNAASAWVRRRDGDYAGLYQGVLGTTGAFNVVRDFPTEVWHRYEWATSSSVGDVFVPVDARATAGAMTAQPIDILIDLMSIELGARHPTSSIRGSTSSTRDKDSLYLAPHEVPLVLRTNVSIWTLAPQWSTVDLRSGDIKVIAAFGVNGDCLRLRHTGVDVRIEAYAAGIVKASSTAMSFTGSFASPASAFEVVVNPVVGTIAVSGVVGAVGTPWTWADGPYRHGGSMSGDSEFCGGISFPRVAS